MSNRDFLPVSTSPDTEGIAQVVGGVGGIRFQWEELDRGAQVVGAAADQMREIAEGVGWVGVRLSALRSVQSGSASMALAAPVAGSAAMEAVQVARQRVQDTEAELEDTERKIQLSRFAYETAEAMAGADLRAVRDSIPFMPFFSPPLTLERAQTEEIPLSGSVDGLLARVPEVDAEPGAAFEVLEVDGEAGPTYVVVIPGTDGMDWHNPFSTHGIAEAELGNSRYVSDAVSRALQEVGAPTGANVVLVGYSQGGMHAMNLSNRGELPQNYSVNMVITAGSPIDDEPVREKTTYLHLEHQFDGVPLADFQPQTAGPNQVSVVLDNPMFLLPGEDVGLGPAHKLRSYRIGAQAVDESSHPSLTAATAALGAAVTGATAKRHVFAVTRPGLLDPKPAPSRQAHISKRKIGGR